MGKQSTTNSVHDCSDHRLNCCHSSEAVLLLLSQFPTKLSVTEISELTHFHRNTLSSTLNSLEKDGIIKKDFKNNFSLRGVKEFYRRMAWAIERLPTVENPIKMQIARTMAYDMTKQTLNDSLVNGPEFTHKNIHEAMMHLQMAYPFNDIVKLEGKSELSTRFESKPKPGANKLTKKEFNLRIYSCICEGEKGLHTACAMVEGALEGAIEGAVGLKSNVKWHSAGKHERDDGKIESWCEYNIQKINLTT